ncbi:hypothetical protein [Massilia aquatica]|uniref:hypothetical protein n=1 Tax=Massilia aquatica TaxID=2609000 RepID=UPI0014230965|nr:hypothetical protein [Massilia aquatica]
MDQLEVAGVDYHDDVVLWLKRQAELLCSLTYSAAQLLDLEFDPSYTADHEA